MTGGTEGRWRVQYIQNILCVVVAEGGTWPKVISTYVYHCGMRVCIQMCNVVAICKLALIAYILVQWKRSFRRNAERQESVCICECTFAYMGLCAKYVLYTVCTYVSS